MNLKISVIGNHTCILADINAYKIDDIEEGGLLNEGKNRLNKKYKIKNS